ncbi:primase-helicase family protein [Myroides sp. LJL115]
MNLDSAEFIRVGTAYYAIIEKPTINNATEKVMLSWNKETIVNDQGKEYISSIKKYYGFCCIPGHIDYIREVSDFYNIYHPIDYIVTKEPIENIKYLESKITNTLRFIRHIFGEQYNLGLDYLKILLQEPTQVLPVLVLVSKARETGKSTMLKYLRKIFSFNATYINAESFVNNFNSDLDGKLLVLVDEVVTDNQQITERIKFLSTADRNKIERKGRDKEEVESFYKFILTSNFEDSFMKIDKEEIRFWVRQIPEIEKDPNFLDLLFSEIPDFLNYLYSIEYSTEKKTRMWFTPEQIRTDALVRLMNSGDNKTRDEVLNLFQEIFESLDLEQIFIAPKDICAIIKTMNRRSNITPNEVRKVLKHLGFSPSENSFKYDGLDYTIHGEFYNIERKGRFYTIEKEKITSFFDANDAS